MEKVCGRTQLRAQGAEQIATVTAVPAAGTVKAETEIPKVTV